MTVAYSADALIYDPVTQSWSLRPDFNPNLHRIDIEFSDDDRVFNGDFGADEVGSDANQTAVIRDMDGNVINAGRIYDEEFYVVSDGASPQIYIERVEINGVHVGYLVNTPLSANTSYSQTAVSDVDDRTATSYSTFSDVPCFATGTPIATPEGPRAVETLRPGDRVLTLGRGARTIRWTHHGDQPLDRLGLDARPVLIAAHALGPGRPAQDMIVSPQHRMLVGGQGQLQHLFGREVLVPAKSLAGLPGIRHMAGKRAVTWYHFACARHAVVVAAGCYAESLLLGPMVLGGLDRATRTAVMAVFGPPPFAGAALNGPAARDCLSVSAVRRLLDRQRATAGARTSAPASHDGGEPFVARKRPRVPVGA